MLGPRRGAARGLGVFAIIVCVDDQDLPPIALQDDQEPRGAGPERRIRRWFAAILISQLAAVAVVVALSAQIRQDIDALEVRLAEVEAASKEPQRVTVPDVQGLRVKEAMAILGAAGLLPVVDAQTPDGVRVVGQRPPAGDRVLPGIRVVVTLANPDGEVIVPGVTGWPVHTAMAALSALGFQASVDDWDPSRADMVVVAQEPPGGALVPAGAHVGMRAAKDEGG